MENAHDRSNADKDEHVKQWLRIYRTALIALTLLIGACTTTVYLEKYVAKDPLPEAPTLAVMPGSLSKSDIVTADYVSGLLISCGCQVFERTATIKETEQYDGSTASAGFAFGGSTSVLATGGSRGSGTKITSGDIVEAVKTTDANYVAFVRDAGSKLWRKLVRRDGGRVLYSGYFTPSDTSEKSPQAKSLGAWGRMSKLLTEAGVIR